MKRQLDMFRAEVLPFPFDRRWREVQQAARFLNVVHGAHADRWWRKTCMEMAKRLRKAGVPEDEIRAQVLTFQEAVQIALQELTRKEKQA